MNGPLSAKQFEAILSAVGEAIINLTDFLLDASLQAERREYTQIIYSHDPSIPYQS